jgi:hypothetical protein
LAVVFDVLQMDADNDRLLQIRNDIVCVALRLGALRFLSVTQRLAINLSDVDPERFVGRKCLTFSWQDCLTVLQERSGVGVLPENLNELVERLCSDTNQYPPEQICSGHELVRLLSLALQKKHGDKRPVEVKPIDLEDKLRLAYSHRDFDKTKLAEGIRSWETDHRAEILKQT